MQGTRVKTLLILLLSLLITVSAMADKKKPGEKDKKKKKSKFKEYSEVITKEAKTYKGIFTVHRVDDKLYYEINPKQMGKEFLWITQLSKTQTGYNWGGTPVTRQVVRWERHGSKILLKGIDYRIQAKDGTPEAVAVKVSSLPSIIGAYKIICFNKDKTPVIDVTGLFVGDVAEFSPKRTLGVSSMDKKRTMLNSVKVFPINIETRVLATFKPKPPKPGTFRRSRAKSVTVEIHHSMINLPEKPMMARLRDDRVGYFSHTYEDYSGGNIQKVEKVRVIHRFRLEKKNPKAKISEPVKPIVFYVGRGVPQKYKPYVKKGIEAWNVAFKQAGFKNAIIGKYAPSREEDPDWDAEDARYSSIRWLPSLIANARGPHQADPRSGETLEADVLLFHNVVRLSRDWFYVQASPNLPRAQKLPLPDDIMGELIQFVTTHEVGHSLGLRHNFKASSQYSVKQIRDRKFTEKNGHTPSIMDYARFNYIAQPGDGASLIPKISAYDKFAIEWGYKQFTGVKSPKDEKPYLDKIAARQLTDPHVRFGYGRESGLTGFLDYTAQTEDLGNDAVEATRLGMKNLKRVMGYIVKGTTNKNDNYDELENMYSAVLAQYAREVGHVANMVGGVEIHNKVYGMKGDVYTPLAVSRQKQAVKFLVDNCFTIPRFLLKKDVIDRVGMHSLVKTVAPVQRQVLESLLSSYRADLIGDIETAGHDTYPVVSLISDLKNGIFSEIAAPGAKIGKLRRNLQQLFIGLLGKNISRSPVNADLRAASRFHLKKLAAQLKTYKAGNDITQSHILDLYERISDALEATPKEKK